MRFSREVFPETQRLLQRLYRQSRHHQVRQRAHCILLSSQDYSIAQLMEIFSVSRKTLYNWFNNWEAQGVLGLYNRPGRGRKNTFSPEQIAQIRAWVQQQPKQLKQVVQKVQAEWDISISTKTIKRVLKVVQMSWHRFRRVVGGQPNAQEYDQKQRQLEAMNYPAASGRGIKIKKESIAHLGVTSDSHSPDFAHISRSCLHLHVCPPYSQSNHRSKTLPP